MASTLPLPQGMQITVEIRPGFDTILTSEALEFVAKLHRTFEPRRQALLKARADRTRQLDAGERPGFLPETQPIRESDWTIAPLPKDLECRRVEITGPVDRKMIINALNSGADSFMADFEDSNAPSWDNQITGQLNLMEAVRCTISLEQNGKSYELHEKIATLIVRPRGWHLDEKHVTVDDQRVSGGIFDFALFFFHNAKEQLARGTGPYFYLPKMESHLEARLWNDIFVAAQEEAGIARGTIRATVLIETILAAFEMDEILYEMREHSLGPERRPLGLYFLGHQEVQERQGLLSGGSFTDHDDRAVHACVCVTAAEDLPPSQCARDRRNERVDSDKERSGCKRKGDGRRALGQGARCG